MTTIGLVKTALLALWQDTFDSAEVRVTFGNRVTVTTGAARLVIGKASGTLTPESLGPQRTVEEEYDVECEISFSTNGSADDQEAVTLAVLALYEGAEYAVRAVPGQNLGIPEVMWAGVQGGFDLREAPASETRGPVNASFIFSVHVRAMYRLT